jgi:hypothetical protein
MSQLVEHGLGPVCTRRALACLVLAPGPFLVEARPLHLCALQHAVPRQIRQPLPQPDREALCPDRVAISQQQPQRGRQVLLGQAHPIQARTRPAEDQLPRAADVVALAQPTGAGHALAVGRPARLLASRRVAGPVAEPPAAALGTTHPAPGLEGGDDRLLICGMRGVCLDEGLEGHDAARLDPHAAPRQIDGDRCRDAAVFLALAGHCPPPSSHPRQCDCRTETGSYAWYTWRGQHV